MCINIYIYTHTRKHVHIRMYLRTCCRYQCQRQCQRGEFMTCCDQECLPSPRITCLETKRMNQLPFGRILVSHFRVSYVMTLQRDLWHILFGCFEVSGVLPPPSPILLQLNTVFVGHPVVWKERFGAFGVFIFPANIPYGRLELPFYRVSQAWSYLELPFYRVSQTFS